MPNAKYSSMSHFEAQAAPQIAATIAGKQYRLSPLRYSDHAEAARRIRAERTSPRDAVKQIGRGLPLELQKHLVELAYRDLCRGETPDLHDVAEWYRTPQGALYRKWLMLRRCHPELTIEAVDELLAQAAIDELDEFDRASHGVDGLPAGNLSSPPLETMAGTAATA